MLFLSPHRNYILTGVVQAQDNYHPNSGIYLNTTPGIDASFGSGAPGWAIEQALDTPFFHHAWGGLPDEQPRAAMIGAYDTDWQAEQNGWDAETKEHVEQFLLKQPDFGYRFFKFDPPHVTLSEPWRGFDNAQWKQVAVIARELDPESQRYTLEYELANKNRTEVVKQLQELVGEDAEVIVAA